MRTATFAEVLTQTLAGWSEAPRTGRDAPLPRWQPSPSVLSGPRLVPFPWTPYARHSAPHPPRPARLLTARQREALAGLVALGARLAPDFTARELRTAFRALARRYHPDSHPHGAAEDTVRLARLFDDVLTHHRTLLGAVPPERHLGQPQADHRSGLRDG